MRKKNTAKSVRISKKRVFVKKLVSTFIVCALFTAAITAGVVTYIRGECISVSGQASQYIKLGYDKGLGEPFIRMAITELSGHNDITDTFVAVYDENGDYYIRRYSASKRTMPPIFIIMSLTALRKALLKR